ncbi:MAG: hypothetical protein QM238_00165 [Bacteroidota bacterium]|nr:hypothetical protein [Bacteroidota bacterium]
MTKIYGNVEAPEGEQQICVTCGLCCDGTLFMHATLQPGERGHLPDKIEEAGCTGEEGDYFLLPCGYFSGSCTIYELPRADVCSTYRCSLLKLFAGGGISQEDALRTVREAVAMRDEVIAEYRRVTGKDAVAGFRMMLVDLGAVMKELKGSGAAGDDSAAGAATDGVSLAGGPAAGVTASETSVTGGPAAEVPLNGVPAGDFEMLLIRCNILEALLIKAFMPAEEFEKYVMK